MVAAGASLLLYRLLINRPQSAKAAPATAADRAGDARHLEIGTVLKEEDVKLADWPGAVPLGVGDEDAGRGRAAA